MSEIELLNRIRVLEKRMERLSEKPAPFIEDLRFPAVPGLRNPSTEKPDYDYTNLGFLFDAGTEESVYIIAQMPHSWVAGGIIFPHVHWMPTSTNTGNVLWVMEYKWTNISEVDASSYSYPSTTVAASGTAYQHMFTEIGTGIDGAGKTSSSILSIRLYRAAANAADTYTGDALLKEFDIHYLFDPTKTYFG